MLGFAARNPWIGGWQGGEQAGAAIDADHLELVSDQTAADQVAKKALPFGSTFADCQTKIDDLLLTVGAQAKDDQHRPPDSASPGAPGQYHAVQHQHPVVALERAGMKSANDRIELLGDQAYGGRADRAPEDRQQRFADPRFREGRLLRTDSPRTKHDRIIRSTCSGRRA